MFSDQRGAGSREEFHGNAPGLEQTFLSHGLFMGNAGKLTSRLMAAVCVGLFVSAMGFDALSQPGEEFASDIHRSVWHGFQFGLPLLVGGVCLTGKRWAAMVGVMYGTVGLALDIATFVQGMASGTDSLHFVGLILLTALFNFLLIVIGGRRVLTV